MEESLLSLDLLLAMEDPRLCEWCYALDWSFHQEENFFQDLSLGYLLGEEEAILSARHFFTSSTTTHKSFLQDELDSLFDGDILSLWADMEEGAYLKRGKAEAEEEEEEQKPVECGAVEKKKKPTEMQLSEVKAPPLTFELVSRHFCKPMKQAAQDLNVGVTLLKTTCRALGISRWPHRKMKSLQTLIKNVQELGEEEELTRIAVEMLQQTRKLIEERPDVALDDMTKTLRQACYKENHKRRRLREIDE